MTVFIESRLENPKTAREKTSAATVSRGGCASVEYEQHTGQRSASTRWKGNKYRKIAASTDPLTRAVIEKCQIW
jgi:hypothetical protein